MIRRLWNLFWRPSSTLGLGVLLVIGAVVGVIVWGGFNTYMEHTNTLGFCISCHEMRNTVFVEYQETVHFKNASGVRAVCADCHVPRPWLEKVVRKIQATNELYHKLVGTIDTPEKFEHRRLELAERVWASMKASDSRECRNCHSFDTMDFHKQRPAAAAAMALAAQQGGTCIDCHRGIAHKMPDLAARAREQAAAFMSQTEPLDGQSLLTKRSTSMLAEPDNAADKLGTVLPGVPAAKLERKGDFVKVRIDGWQAGAARRGQYAAFGKRILNMSIAPGAVDSVNLGEKRFYQEANQDWTRSSLVGWLPAADLTEDLEMLWQIAEASYSSQCGTCHAAKPPASRDGLTWQADMKTYQPRTGLTEEEGRLVLRFLQVHSPDFPKGGS